MVQTELKLKQWCTTTESPTGCQHTTLNRPLPGCHPDLDSHWGTVSCHPESRSLAQPVDTVCMFRWSPRNTQDGDEDAPRREIWPLQLAPWLKVDNIQRLFIQSRRVSCSWPWTSTPQTPRTGAQGASCQRRPLTRIRSAKGAASGPATAAAALRGGWPVSNKLRDPESG